MSNERIERLEERMAWLERHVTEQDKVMLEMNDLLRRMREEIGLLRESSIAGGRGGPDEEPDEKPPHY